MAKTKIGWCKTIKPDGTFVWGYTFNGWKGCTKVGEAGFSACDFCWAESMAGRLFKEAKWGKGQKRVKSSAAYMKQPLAWNRKAEREGVRYKVFANSMSDIFDTEVPDEWRHEIFELIRKTPHLDWLLLTKRPHVAFRYFHQHMNPTKDVIWNSPDEHHWPQNAWLGTTVESPRYMWRTSHIAKVPAPVLFLSVEPLIEPFRGDDLRRLTDLVDWIIVGGESGPKARPMPGDWARLIKDRCARAGVKFFMKQMSGRESIPPDLMVEEFPR